jgi:hypothetical protein
MGMRLGCGRFGAGFCRRQRRRGRLRSPRPLAVRHRQGEGHLRSPRPLGAPGPARPSASRQRSWRLRSSLPAVAAVLAGPGHRPAASPFESARPAHGSVGSLGLVPPQPLAVLATLRASALARLEAPGGWRTNGRHEVARGEPAAGSQRAPIRLTRLARASRAVRPPAGSGIRKRASATPAEPARQRRAEPSPALGRGGVGTPAPRWNHHMRTLSGTTTSWRTSEGEPSGARRTPAELVSAGRRGCSAVPGRSKDRRAPLAPEDRSEARRPEHPRASVASPSPSATPRLSNKVAYIEQKTRTNTEVNT